MVAMKTVCHCRWHDSRNFPVGKEKAMQNPLKKVNLAHYWRKAFVKWGVAIIALLIVVYGVVGFFVVPGILRDKAQAFVYEKFERTLAMSDVSFNPFTLTAEIDGMRLSEHGRDDPFLTFDHLTLNVSAQSIFRMAPVIEEIRLVNPVVRLVRTDSHHYNIDDFVAFAMEPKEDDSPARFSINNIQIENATIEFDDQPKKKRHVLNELNVTVPFVSSIPSQVDIFVDLAVSGKFNNENIALTGKARPFFREKDGMFTVNLDRIDLPVYVDYLPFTPKFALKDGKVSIHMNVGFGQAESGKPGLTMAGNVLLESLVLDGADGHPVARIPSLGVDLAQSDILSGNIGIDRIELKSPELYLDRNRAGVWNVLQLADFPQDKKTDKVVSAGEDNADKTGIPWHVTLKQFVVRDGMFRINDQIHVVPANFSVDHFGLNVEGVVLDVPGRHVMVEKVASEGTDIRFLHGKLKWQQQARTPAKALRQAASEAGEKTGFGFQVNRAEIRDWSIHFENRDAGMKVVTDVDGLTVIVDNLSSEQDRTVQVALDAKVNQRGTLSLAGNLNLSPLKGDIDLDFRNVDVRFVQPYIEDFVNLSVRQADLTLQGKLQLTQTKNQNLQARFTGNAGIGRLVTVDQLSKQPFVSWNDLSLKGIRFDLKPLSVVVDQVRLNNLAARVILGSNGRLNLQDIMRSETGGRKSLTDAEEKGIATTAQAASADTNAETARKKRPDYSVRIGKWLINNGKIRFSDNFIRPRYTANLVNLQGSVSGLSTAVNRQAAVNIRGRVNGAPLVIAGSFNPFGSLALDIKAKVKGMELAQFSAYSGKYIGYGIEKGKLSFDVAYKVENDQLSAENSLILDQLTLGEKVESESAVNLPVSLALSLLKDRNGVIDINLPIGGSLNDPEFSVGGIVLRVIVNLIQKTVTAPFSLLASLIGDSEELSWLPFDPGSYAISADGEKKLGLLARALEERPGLSLEIAGRYDPAIDSEGLGKMTILRKIKTEKARKMGQTVAVKDIVLSEKEYADGVKRLYGDEDFDKPRNWIGFSKSLPLPEMEKLLSRHYAGKKDDMIRLADRRAQAVKNWLVEQGKAPEERLFVMASKARESAGDESGNRVDFSLK